MKEELKKIIIIFILFIFFFETASFIFTKLGLFKFNDIPSYKLNNSYTGVKWRIENDDWGAWHKANYTDKHVTDCFDVTYKSNDIGARSNIDFLKLKNKNNVIILGDSMVEGYGINIEETFAYNLEKFYGKKGLNFGSANNIGPLQSYLLYKNFYTKIPHNEVIYFFVPANDFLDNSINNPMYYENRHGRGGVDLSIGPFMGFINASSIQLYDPRDYENRHRPYFKKNNGEYAIVYPKFNEIVYPKFNEKNENNEEKKNKNIKSKKFYRILKDLLINFTYSGNALKTFRAIYYFYFTDIGKKYEYRGFYTKNKYDIDGSLYFIKKMFDIIPIKYKKTLIIVTIGRDLNMINKTNWEYRNLYWYKQIKEIVKQYNINFIDLALKNGKISGDYLKDQKKWFLTCDGHLNKFGNKSILKQFVDSN